MTSSRPDLLQLRDVGEALRRTVAADRPSPAYLFEGVDAGDAREAALLFAAELLAGGPPSGRLLDRVLALDHPDVQLVERDKPTVISVERLAERLEDAYRTPLEAPRQVFVLDPAEAMEAAGVARYLKTLEEPPAHTVFLLVSTRPDRLPATVLSRVRRVRLPPRRDEDVTRRLVDEGLDAPEAARLARWAAGSLARARRLREGETGRIAAMLVSREGGVAAAVQRALAAIDRTAGERVEAGATGQKRQEVRLQLQDLLHVLAIEARDRAAGRAAPLLDHLDADRALVRLEDAGRLAAAAAQNVTPAIVLLEIARRFGVSGRRSHPVP